MLDVVRQDTNWSCFAASLAMVTGLDYDLMNKNNEAAPAVYPVDGGLYTTLDPVEAGEPDDEWVSVYDWLDMLEYNGYTGEVFREAKLGREGIMIFTVIESRKDWWSHAVAIDKFGYATCPSSTFDEMHLTEFYNSCNIMVAGFVTVQEK